MRQDKTLKIRSNHISESPLHFALPCSSTCSLQLSRTWLLQLSSVAVAAAACWVDCPCHCRCRCRCHSCRGPLPTVPLGRLYRAVARFTILPAVMPGTKVQEHSGSDKAMVSGRAVGMIGCSAAAGRPRSAPLCNLLELPAEALASGSPRSYDPAAIWGEMIQKEVSRAVRTHHPAPCSPDPPCLPAHPPAPCPCLLCQVWSCVDFADESQRMELFCIRFASAGGCCCPPCAVCVLLHAGRLMGLVGKLHADAPWR